MKPILERRPAAFGAWFGFVLAAAAAVAALWFLERIVIAVLLLFFALVVSIALLPLRAMTKRPGPTTPGRGQGGDEPAEAAQPAPTEAA